MGQIEIQLTEDKTSVAEALGCAIGIMLVAVLVGLVTCGFYTDLVAQHPIVDRVGEVHVLKDYPGDKLFEYVVQLESDGAFIDIGEGASKNLVAGECYLLRQGFLSMAYNLFEPSQRCDEYGDNYGSAGQAP